MLYGWGMELEISSSPRSTWVWARDAAESEEIHRVLTAARCSTYPANGLPAGTFALELDIGVVAMECLNALARVGYTFRWHTQQYEMNRPSIFLGINVSPPRGE